MKINIGDKYVIEVSSHDFVLCEKKVAKSGKSAGSEVLSRLGYYNKLEQLINALIVHDVKKEDVQSLQAMQKHIELTALECVKAFEVAREGSH
ncbi:DUF5405 family protein [Chimaeribacter arupi]|uniref:DUF5405 family protein n=1 Tax=Chimaeribacter arupi TaxID=2060066 RepID=UPI000C7D9B61|nr:DUF5405 family protein [Chimaeribacter arupi]PLR52375.1 hypothetical protein CYR52_07405 [Chimaeribacter arupi]WKZ94055.1 DUF5405 family protein [Chimaeribacter arupi]